MATNENDENIGTTRLTRAKAAALSVDDLASAAQKPLQAKKSGLQLNQPLQRKRAALGDVSNVTKGDGAAEGKKALGKSGLVSKAAQPTGIQKNVSRSNSTRTALGSKDNNKKASVELKRTASGSGVLGGGITKKRQTTSSTSSLSIKETVTEDEEPARKKIHTSGEKRTASELMDENKVDSVSVEAVKEPAVEDQVLDLDAEDIDDPLMVAEYVHEIFDYLKELEVATMPNPVYMKHQEDLEWKMRGILVDWLIEVHTRFHLLPET